MFNIFRKIARSFKEELAIENYEYGIFDFVVKIKMRNENYKLNYDRASKKIVDSQDEIKREFARKTNTEIKLENLGFVSKKRGGK